MIPMVVLYVPNPVLSQTQLFLHDADTSMVYIEVTGLTKVWRLLERAASFIRAN